MSQELQNSKLMTKPGFVDTLKLNQARVVKLAKNLSKTGKITKEIKKLIKK